MRSSARLNGCARRRARRRAATSSTRSCRADGLVAERQRRIAAVSDELLAKAEAVVGRLDDAAPVRDGFENLVRALGDAAERLARETEVRGGAFEPEPFHEVAYAPARPEEPAAAPVSATARPSGFAQPARPPEPATETRPPAQPSPAQPHPARAPSSAPSRPSPPSNWRQIDDARMVAIQMATTGATRAGVREHLNHALGIVDTAAILDEIFGAGTGEDAQVPWTATPR